MPSVTVTSEMVTEGVGAAAGGGEGGEEEHGGGRGPGDEADRANERTTVGSGNDGIHRSESAESAKPMDTRSRAIHCPGEGMDR